MEDYSDEWRQYLEIEEEVPETLEVLARFHTHLCSIPVREDLPRKERDTGKYGGIDLVLEGYSLERPEGYRDFLEDVKEGEDFSRIETAELYIHLGSELDNVEEVKSAVERIENSGATPLAIRELSKLTGEAIDQKLQEAVQQET